LYFSFPIGTFYNFGLAKKACSFFACTCGERPKHFIEDMNLETRQGWGTCPQSRDRV